MARLSFILNGVVRDERALTKREKEVVEWVVTGLSNREVAQLMGLNEQVVKNYLKVIYEKMGVESRVRLILKFYEKPIAMYRADLEQ
jgi:DNA-binding CsgD family transcriptional regulator